MNWQKVIAFALLAAGGISAYLKSFTAVLFFASALVLLFSKDQFRLFKSSFRPVVLYCAVIEAVFSGFALFIVWLASFVLNRSALAAMRNTDIGTKVLESAAVLQQNIAAAGSFFTVLWVVLVVASVLLFFAYSVSRYFIWKILAKKVRFWKFILVLFAWWIIWAVVFFFVFTGVRREIVQLVFIIVLLAYLYLSFFVQFAALKKGVMKSFSAAFSGAYVVPVAYAFSAVVLVSQFFRIHLAVGFVLLLVFIAWARYYFFTIKKR